MPIEIISKPEVKRNPLSIILLIVFLIVALSLSGTYFYFSTVSKELDASVKKLQEKLVKTPEEKALEEQLVAYETKINDFAEVLSKHKRTPGALEFLEQNCHPDIWFSSFDFTSTDNKVLVSGQAKTFAALEQQLGIFKKNDKLKEVNLSGISISKEGDVSFSFQLTLDSQIFK